MRSKKSPSGFSLIEVMAAISISAILLAVAVPSFENQIRNARVTAAANNLVSAILFARNRSIGNNIDGPVELCPIQNAASTTCNGSQKDWSHGWLVGQRLLPTETNGIILRRGEDVSNSVAIETDSPFLRFRKNGTLLTSWTEHSIILCRKDQVNDKGQCPFDTDHPSSLRIVINALGRPRLQSPQ